MTRSPAVSDATRAAFARDGVVCVRAVLDDAWIGRMRAAVARIVDGTADMTAMAARPSSSDAAQGAGRFRAGIDHWRTDTDFAAFATQSPLVDVVAALLESTSLVLYEDSVLVKEPNTDEKTHWHQDLGYFHVEGDQIATTWCPLDATDDRSGAVRYLRGSHRWGRVFRPNLFVTDEPIPGTEGDAVPDVEATADPEEIVGFTTAPGDVVVHHAATLHAAGPNRSSTRARRAISVRYCGDDVRVRIRAGAPRKPEQARWSDGALLREIAAPDFPVLETSR